MDVDEVVMKFFWQKEGGLWVMKIRVTIDDPHILHDLHHHLEACPPKTPPFLVAFQQSQQNCPSQIKIGN